MKQKYFTLRYFTVLAGFILVFCSTISCQSDSSASNETDQNTNGIIDNNILHTYTGSIDHSEYDSLYNTLILYKGDTFSITQVARTGEHHLNEKSATGQYLPLANGEQLGLFLHDGTLIMRFKKEGDLLYFMDLDGTYLANPDRPWQPK